MKNMSIKTTAIGDHETSWDSFLEVRSWCIDHFGPESHNTIPGWHAFYAENSSRETEFPVFRFWLSTEDTLLFRLTWGDKFELL